MTEFWHDVSYAVRVLRRSPVFSVVATLTLALGMGANSAMFAVVDSLLFKSLPFPAVDRLMFLHLTEVNAETRKVQELPWSFAKYQAFVSAQHTFEDSGVFISREVGLSGAGEPERVYGEIVGGNYPAVLGVQPVLGRLFSAAEVNQRDAAPAALISHELWIRRFGGDASISSQTLTVNARPYTVVGVLPPGFHGVTGNTQIWLPIAAHEPANMKMAQAHSYTLVARRAASVPEQTAAAEVRLLGTQINRAQESGPGEWSAVARSFSASRIDTDLRQATVLLLAAVAFLLLIACVNLTNLIAVRAVSRTREMAVRSALGATRVRLLRQFAAEGLVLATAGAVAGLLVAAALLKGAPSLLPSSMAFLGTPLAPGNARVGGAAGLTRIAAGTIGLDARVLLCMLTLMFVSVTLLSLAPALRVSDGRLAGALNTGMRAGTMRGFGWLRTRAVLVTTQLALTLMLISGAGLMIKTASRLSATPPGIQPDHLALMSIRLPRPQYTAESGNVFFGQLLARLKATPGVESAGLGNCPPASGGCNETVIWFPPAKPDWEKAPPVGVYWASPGYFETAGIRLIRGRTFTDQDRAGQPKVVVVSRKTARAFWPDGSAIGRTIAVGQGGFNDGAQIVGIVADVRYAGIATLPSADVYLPLAQAFQPQMLVFVRSELTPATLSASLVRQVRDLDRNLPVGPLRSMPEQLADSIWRTRVLTWLVTLFAGLALLLTAIGMFGVMAQTVGDRKAEIGIRMALGAHARQVMLMIVGRGAAMITAGLAIGLAGALATNRLIGGLLYEVTPSDPVMLASAAAVLVAVALLACYLPARRSINVDPVAVLRGE